MDNAPAAPGTTNRTVVVTATALIVACVLFAAAFYYFDGASLVAGLFNDTAQTPAPASGSSAPATEQPSAEGLVLPDGMDEDFALRVWQEQIDSQKMITKLVEGEIESLVIDDGSVDGDVATLKVHVTMRDGSNLPGELGMRRYGSIWYIGYISGQHDGETAGVPTTELPAVDEVDTELLNTIMEQPPQSAEITEDLAMGRISSVDVESIADGPNTTTITLRMVGAKGEDHADLIAISEKVDGEDVWFLARFDRATSASEN